jgi:hypothetical protein
MYPNVQLGVLAQLWGNLEVAEAYGRGSFYGEPATISLPYGKLTSQMAGTAYLEYKWNQGLRPTIADIWDSFRANGVPDISIDKLTYVKRAKVKGRDTLLFLKFGKDAVRPQVYERIVKNGAIPKQETYEAVKLLKAQVASSGFPQDVVKRIRPSVLILYGIQPYSDLIYDAYAVYSLKEPNTFFIKEVYKRWELYDYEFRTAP